MIAVFGYYVVSYTGSPSFWLLRIKLLGTHMYQSLYEQKFSFLLGPSPRVQLLGHLRSSFLVFFFFFLSFSRAAPVAYGGSQARGLIRAVAAGLRQSHSNVGSEPHLRPTP